MIKAVVLDVGSVPVEIAFLDVVPENIEAARACGWHGVLHTEGDAATSIARVERLLADRQ